MLVVGDGEIKGKIKKVEMTTNYGEGSKSKEPPCVAEHARRKCRK